MHIVIFAPSIMKTFIMCVCRIHILAIGATVAVLCGGSASATTITFEAAQGYSDGSIGAVNGSTTNAPFTGQQDWSRSTSVGTGAIFATTTSGEYVGGQALSGGTGGPVSTYIGGKVGVVSVTGVNSITFDALFVAGQAVTAGFLGDDGDGLYDQNSTVDTGMQFGGLGGGLLSTARAAGFGSALSISGLTGTLTTGDWYRYSIAIGESLSGNRSITMALRNLTNGADVDLNGAGSGNTITFSVTDAQFGIAPENAVGGVVRVSGNGNAAAIDNVTFTAVPEPTTIATLGAAVSLLGLHIARRRRMWSFKTNVSPND